MHSERLGHIIQIVDEGKWEPVAAWFLTAGGFITGKIVSRTVYEKAHFDRFVQLNEDGTQTKGSELLMNEAYEAPPFSDPPEVLLINAQIHQGNCIQAVVCLCLNQADIITWGVGEQIPT